MIVERAVEMMIFFCGGKYKMKWWRRGEYNVWMPPKKQYSGEIPCNLLVLVLCIRRYILQKIPGKLGNIIWGTTLYCGTRENRRYRRLQLVLLLLLLLFVFLWRVARKWDRDIACSYILASIFYFFFYVQLTQGTGVERGRLLDCRETVWLTNILPAHLKPTMSLPLSVVRKNINYNNNNKRKHFCFTFLNALVYILMFAEYT